MPVNRNPNKLPHDSEIVVMSSESATVYQLKRQFDKSPPLLELDPAFQRENVWSQKQKSQLIESILMGIPLPSRYVRKDRYGAYTVLDGEQRMSALFQFMNDNFQLEGLNVLTDLIGASFSKQTTSGTVFKNFLSPTQQRKIEDCPLTLHVIKPPTSDRMALRF